jgi:hypothetical protein
MSNFRVTTGAMVLAVLWPLPAYAHGEEAVVLPILLVLASHLIPVADLGRRGSWGYAAFFIVTQPVLWGIAAAVAYVIATIGSFFVGEEAAVSIAVVLGLVIFAVLPFAYWRRLLRWRDTDG